MVRPGCICVQFSIGTIEVRAMQLDPTLFEDYERDLRNGLKVA